MRQRVEFRLTMPGIRSWNGKWSGEDQNLTVVRSLTPTEVQALELPNSWRHHWKDGWCARVSARLMEKGERRAKSDGFHGYEWIVQNVLLYGRAEACPQESDHDWRPDSVVGWERCPRCRTSRRIP